MKNAERFDFLKYINKYDVWIDEKSLIYFKKQLLITATIFHWKTTSTEKEEILEMLCA